MTNSLPDATSLGDLSIDKALCSVRTYLGMDVAYLSEFIGDRTVFRNVDAPGLENLIKPGDSQDLDAVYCRHILEGRLPKLMPNTADEPIAVGMPITTAVPIGSHMSIPVRLPDGELYGMFCCLSAQPNPSLNERDLTLMQMFADLAAERVADHVKREREQSAIRQRIAKTLDDGGFDLVYQPIVDLAKNAVAGFECLSRFSAEPYRPPNIWFDEARLVGMNEDLELAAIRRALKALPAMPDDVYLSINASPDIITGGNLAAVLLKSGPAQLKRIVLEVTEHHVVPDYDLLHETLDPIRSGGVRLAVDDAGAGYSSLSHILQLRPDIIKLDMKLVRDIDTDTSRRSLAAAIAHFAREIGVMVVAEGIETAAEEATLRTLGIDKGQGYRLGRPQALESTLALFPHHIRRIA
ncbi:Putative diguanylate phosphodiesterase (EAL domain) with GAF sensor [Fulvimarina pelagi HTCC2506]|uniref:Putative diguanylate phosphodiesterase (EAL domain) with GAF sensor n=2 Tax=Fulvimarina pelagi TaxID=217511 RepID=Q0G0H9_9HYPH|nr:EAL domain-containing protein [Fulvimarina pelagi]EAU40614.1 Putative diguanylate phosphodiesterase (EAL domain) with GAF sensor [Fulvimarina pelagi HTCC2506]BAT31163.1 putative diguanylate phosphodiesterase with GAF sensor [Fulvimarina pelagi]